MPKPLLLLTDDRMLAHDAGPGHPERPDRLRAIRHALADLPESAAKWIQPKPATREQLLRAHTSRHVDFIDSLRGRGALFEPESAASPGSVEAAYLAAGAAINAVSALVNADAESAFALVRPPGHHAEADAAMGFCMFNNAAIAAAHAIETLGLRRILIIDWDVHHGNGTQHIFESRSDVLYFSTHQDGAYPGTGAIDEIGLGEGAGYTVNVPLPPGSGDADFTVVFRDVLIPIADSYRPDLVLVSAGFDAHRDDPLAEMRLTESGYATLCTIVKSIAAHHAQGRLALILEGGYDLHALAASVRACVDVLMNPASSDPASEPAQPSAQVAQIIDRARSIHCRRDAC